MSNLRCGCCAICCLCFWICCIRFCKNRRCLPEVESSRTRFEVLGLGLEDQVLGLKASSPRLEDSSIFWIVKILWSAWKIFWITFFRGDCLKNFCEDLFFGDRPKKFFLRPFFFFLESTCACVLGPQPWPRAFCSWPQECLSSERLSLALASDFFVSLALASILVSSTPPLLPTVFIIRLARNFDWGRTTADNM